MKARIVTIFPRGVEARPTATLPSVPPRKEALVPVGGANNNATPTIESVILQKLLAELDARTVARVQAPFLIEPPPPPARPGRLVRTLWALLWVLSMVLCVFIVKYIDSQKLPGTDAAQNTSIRNLSAAVSNQSAQLSKMIESIEAMSGVVASASQHAAALPAMLKRIGSDLREAGALSLPGKVESRPQPAFSTILTPSTILPAPAPTLADSGAISMGGHHHPPVDDVVAMSNVVVHHNPQGVMDYWLVPRVVAGAPVMTKVVPITQTRMGTFVHNVEEVKDYIVTPSGDWIAAPESNEKR